MSRSILQRAAAGLGLWIALGASAALAANRPNILFIYSDDHSYKTVSCYPEAYKFAKTPHIDALASRGVRFTHCYLGSWCMPSRAVLLTGRHPHGIESMRMEGAYPGSTYDPAQCPFWPAELRKAGYHTAQIGKWHTGVDAGFGRDWDYQIVWNRPKHPENAGNYYDRQLLSTNGGSDTMTTGYTTDNYSQWASDYIRGEHRDPSKPWYLWLCYGAIHGPTTPAARHKGALKDAVVPTPADIFGPRPGKPDYLDKTQAWSKGPGGIPVMGKSGEAFGDESAQNARTHQKWVQQVNECVMALDEGIGKVLAALRESGQLENTLVVFSADQGFASGEHGCRSKLCPYDANYRSPLIISMPGTIPEGKVCPQSVNAPDLVVTFHAFARQPLPWKMHGRDLSPLLKDPAAAWPHPTLYEHLGHDYGSDTTKVLTADPKHAVHNNVPWYIALRERNLKYIRYLKGGEMEELYDLAADPDELTNLALLPEHADELARLRAVAVAELRRTEAGFVDHLPPTRQMQP
ncbi:MAG: sulfatase-like hydrolase/transferase [Pirellulaceae bacterium]|nr:sulfatase-like hydrolase/transferase [Pirellulaceae bacterium]